MSVALVNGFLVLMAAFVAVLALAGALAQSRRLDRIERRRAYETECLVKSLQALEQQNLMLSDRINGVVDAGQRIANELDRAARRGGAAEQGAEEQPFVLPNPHRILH